MIGSCLVELAMILCAACHLKHHAHHTSGWPTSSRPQRSLVKFKFGVFFLGNMWSTRSGASESDLLGLTAVTAARSFSCAHCVGLVERLARLCFAALRHVETIYAVKKNEQRLVQCRSMRVHFASFALDQSR
eukprot:COSAG02_NODE_12454_length_1542_cov_1.794179_2_plen_132_part_00